MISLQLFVLKTKELHRLKAQYELLGLSFEYHQHGKGPFHYASKINSIVFEIYPLPKKIEKADETTRLGFQIKNLEEIIHKLEKTDWKIISLPTLTDWGKVAIIQDLDGRKIELTEI